MVRFSGISRNRHGNLRWLSPQNFSFAATEAAVPIVAAEIAKVVPCMPVVFIWQDNHFQLSAMLSITSGSNMFVAPDGRWLVGYKPAFIRSHPFRMLTPEQGGEPILCFDEDSGLAIEGGSDGEAFFSPDGGASPAIKRVLNFLGELEVSRVHTNLAVAALDQAGLIVPWPITLKTAQGDKTVEGLHRIDEIALNALPEDAFLKLRATGALSIAYAQLFSIGQLSVFEMLAKLQEQLAPKPIAPLPDTLDQLFGLTNNDMLRFD